MKNLWPAFKAVWSAFFGVRGGASAAPPQLRARHYIAAGLLSLFLLVSLLLAAVNAVV